MKRPLILISIAAVTSLLLCYFDQSQADPTPQPSKPPQPTLAVQPAPSMVDETPPKVSINSFDSLADYQVVFKEAVKKRSIADLKKILIRGRKLLPVEKQITKDAAFIKSIQGDAKGALSDYTEALRQPTQLDEVSAKKLQATIHNNLGNLYLNLKKLRKAKHHLQEATQLEPGYAPAYYALGSLYMEKKQYSNAKTAYKKAFSLDLAAATPFDYFDTVFLLQEEEEQEDLLRLLRLGKERYPTTIGFHANFAIIHERSAALNLVYYHLLLENLIMNPNNPYLSEVASRMPKIGKEVMKSKGEEFPDLFYFLKGVNALHHQKPKEAEDYYRKALTEKPTLDVMIRLYLAEVLALQGRYEESRKFFQDVSKAAPYLASVQMQLADIEEVLGNKKASIQLRQEARELNPNNWKVLEYGKAASA